MGNCCRRCRNRADTRKYLRTRYSMASELSVEFENLVDNDSAHAELTQYGSAMTDQERALISERKFHDLVQYQIQVDAEIEAQLRRQEDELRREEETLIEAKRQAAKKSVKPSARHREMRNNIDSINTVDKPGVDGMTNSDDVDWVAAAVDESGIMAGEEMFEEFLANAQSRSLTRNVTTVETDEFIFHEADVDSATDKLTTSQTDTRPDLIAVVDVEMSEGKPPRPWNGYNNRPTDINTNNIDDWDADFVSAES